MKHWPVPKKFIFDVMKVLTFIKVTKECILLGLMAHEENSIEAVQCFEKELMPLVVTNLGTMSSATALESLRDLKEKCPFSFGGSKVPTDCWKLDKQIEEFYNAHHW